MERKFYGFKYWSGPKTTTGEPHPRTGRMSIAGDLAVFSSKTARDTWVSNQETKTREAVSARRARQLCAGWVDFDDTVLMLIDQDFVA